MGWSGHEGGRAWADGMGDPKPIIRPLSTSPIEGRHGETPRRGFDRYGLENLPPTFRPSQGGSPSQTKKENPDRVEEEHRLFSCLTTEANGVVSSVHLKVMPVLLTKPERLGNVAKGTDTGRPEAPAPTA